MGARSIQLIIGAEEPNGEDLSQTYVDTYLHGGEEKITKKKLDSPTLPTLDAACPFRWNSKELVGVLMIVLLDQMDKTLRKEMD